MKSDELNFDIELTRNCNFQCKYCFEHDYHINQNFTCPDKLIDFLDAIILSNKYQRHLLGLWGGEPTLNKDLIFLLITRYSKYDNVTFNMYTNGSNLYPFIDIFKQLTESNKLKLQISYDGNPIHDMKRIINNNKTSDLIYTNLQYLYDNKIPFVVKSTIPLDSLNHIYKSYLDVIEINRKYNIKNSSYLYSPTLDFHSNFELRDSDIDIFQTNLFNIAKYELKENKNFFSWFSPNNTNELCSAGCGLFGIDIYGNIFPCHGCFYTDSIKQNDLKFFNIKDDINFIYLLNSIRKEFSTFIYNENESCQKCEQKYSETYLCYRCNISSFIRSQKNKFKEKWMDLDNNNTICNLYKIANNIRNAYFYALINRKLI